MCPLSRLSCVSRPPTSGGCALIYCGVLLNENKVTSVCSWVFVFNFYNLSRNIWRRRIVLAGRGHAVDAVLESVGVRASESCSPACGHSHSPLHRAGAAGQTCDLCFLLSPTTCEAERSTLLRSHRAWHPIQDCVITELTDFLLWFCWCSDCA